MLANPATEAELRGLAEEELRAVRARLLELEQDLKVALLPKDAADEKNAILEIRAGTGGDEAALFAGDLFRMYQRYAELKGWRVEILSASEGTSGGLQGNHRRNRGARRLRAVEIPSPERIGCNGCRKPRPRAAYILRRQLSRFCPKPRMWMSILMKRI